MKIFCLGGGLISKVKWDPARARTGYSLECKLQVWEEALWFLLAPEPAAAILGCTCSH